jgi:hypothetical protein
MYVCMYVCIHAHMNIYMTTSYAHRTHDDHRHPHSLCQASFQALLRRTQGLMQRQEPGHAPPSRLRPHTLVPGHSLRPHTLVPGH